MTPHSTPKLDPEKLDGMVARALMHTQLSPETKTAWWHAVNWRWIGMGSTLAAACVALIVWSFPVPHKPISTATVNEINDIALYDLLEDLS